MLEWSLLIFQKSQLYLAIGSVLSSARAFCGEAPPLAMYTFVKRHSQPLEDMGVLRESCTHISLAMSAATANRLCLVTLEVMSDFGTHADMKDTT